MIRKGFAVFGLVLVLAFSSAVTATSSETLSSSRPITKGFIFNR